VTEREVIVPKSLEEFQRKIKEMKNSKKIKNYNYFFIFLKITKITYADGSSRTSPYSCADGWTYADGHMAYVNARLGRR
jgi:hypothetical protein